MSENFSLSKIERDVVIENLQEGRIPLTVTLHDNEKNAPLVISPSLFTVDSSGLVRISSSFIDIQYFLGKSVYVRFYYKGLGLSLLSAVKKSGQDFCMQLPLTIDRMSSSEDSKTTRLSASLSFYSEKNKKVSITCKSSSSYDIFSKPDFNSLPLGLQKDAKSLLNTFVSEAKRGIGSKIGSGIHLIPVCRFLSEAMAGESFISVENIQGRIKPMQIIYADSKRLVLASLQNHLSLQLESEYILHLSFQIENNSIFKRNIECTCAVENIYNRKDSTCFVCHLLNLKVEDLRFLDSQFSF